MRPTTAASPRSLSTLNSTLLQREQNMPASNEIHARVRKVLVHALRAEEDDIKPPATLQGDLGAEPIDFLHIVFRLEREFGITIRQGELFLDKVFRGEIEIVHDGCVTDEGLSVSRTAMPFADLGALAANRSVKNVADVFTVELDGHTQGRIEFTAAERRAGSASMRSRSTIAA
jgi:acyl carrier protein